MFCGCGGPGFPDVVEARDVSTAYGAPRIAWIHDAGMVRLPQSGPWRGSSDGVVSPGEVLVIDGDNFGRQPTVTIGGRATAILARGAGGAILVRVPTGVPPGPQPISVSQPRGRAEKTVEVRRLAVVLHDGHLYFLSTGRDGPRPFAQPLAVPGARLLRLSGEGGVAYVVATRADHIDQLSVVDLALAQPRVAREIPLAHRVTHFAAAEDAPLLALYGEGKLTLLPIPDPLSPAPFPPLDLPKEAQPARAIELSPDGKVLVVLLADSNRLTALELSPAPSARLISTVDLLPGERLPLARDLAFSPDGETVWVVSGSNAQTVPAVQATRLTAVRLFADEAGAAPSGGRARLLSVWRTQSLPGASAPLRLAIARGQPLASGTTIRMPPEKAAVFITAVRDALFHLAAAALDAKGGAKAAQLWHSPPPAMVVRGELSGGGGPLFTASQLLSAIDLTPDSQWVLATCARVDPAAASGPALEFGVVAGRVFGGGPPAYVSLGPLSAGEVKAPFFIGEIRVQP
jgi:hypothetical protein